ncbi:MAG TPA: HEPN domain-containing protein [Nitrospira sp.]|nr:HEPN domain-containing protein [Nitrospira sp.]
MTEPSRLEEIQAELLRAEKSFAAARSLLRENFLEDALSRAYYSILHAARAVLLAEGVSVSSHRAVRRLFGSHLIKT